MMPLFSREKSSLKGRRRAETVQDMRSSSSNPVSCSETSIKIYGSKEEIRARKSPETVDAPGFAPDASIPVILYVITQHYRFFEICLKKTSYDSKKNLMHRTHLSFDSSVVLETAPSSRSVTTSLSCAAFLAVMTGVSDWDSISFLVRPAT